MNLAYFLLPKSRVAYLFDDCTFRQGLEKMRYHGYTAIPVISRSGRYVGTISEGDFLWKLVFSTQTSSPAPSMRELEKLPVSDILNPDKYPPVRITASMDEMLQTAMNQNFIPVTDDLDSFIGIVTRNSILRYFAENNIEKTGIE